VWGWVKLLRDKDYRELTRKNILLGKSVQMLAVEDVMRSPHFSQKERSQSVKAIPNMDLTSVRASKQKRQCVVLI